MSTERTSLQIFRVLGHETSPPVDVRLSHLWNIGKGPTQEAHILPGRNLAHAFIIHASTISPKHGLRQCLVVEAKPSWSEIDRNNAAQKPGTGGRNASRGRCNSITSSFMPIFRIIGHDTSLPVDIREL